MIKIKTKTTSLTEPWNKNDAVAANERELAKNIHQPSELVAHVDSPKEEEEASAAEAMTYMRNVVTAT